VQRNNSVQSLVLLNVFGHRRVRIEFDLRGGSTQMRIRTRSFRR
jgi:hypothetical protein